MRRALLVALATVLLPTAVHALTLQWASGTDTLNFTNATSAVLRLRVDPPTTTLPSDWRLLWVGDSAQVIVEPFDSLVVCAGDTAAVHDVTGPLSPADSAAHMSTARFCSGGLSVAAQAAWTVHLPARSRGKFVAYAYYPGTIPTVQQSNAIHFNASVSDDFVPNASLYVSQPTSYSEHPVRLTAVIAPTSLAGTVVFREGDNVLATASLLNGIARVTLSDLSVGAHSVVATYDSVSSDTIRHQVLPLITTSTALTVTPSPSRHLRAVTLTAAVSPDTATGDVQFFDGASVLGSVPLVGGMATMNLSAPAAGVHSFRSDYSGDAIHEPSASPSVLHEVIPLDSSRVLLVVTPETLFAGDSAHLEARVTPDTASGLVVFRLGQDSLGSALLNSGVARLAGPVVCAGTHEFSAAYEGDSSHYGSNDTRAVSAQRARIKVTLQSSNMSSRYSAPVRFTAHVLDTSSTPCTLGGSIQFFIDDLPFGTPVALTGDSAVTVSITTLTAGDHRVRAYYAGNANFTPGSSPLLIQQVESPSPELVAVRDVLGDEGGWVKVLWNASYLDLSPFHQIENYWILRSVPSSLVEARRQSGGADPATSFESRHLERGSLIALTDPDTTYYWEYVGSQPALHLPKYSFVAPTTTDSSSLGNPYTAFMIMARTPSGAAWWYSNADSGYSIDNLAPAMPQLLVSESGAWGALITWQPSPESDLAGYRLYRGATEDFPLDSQHVVLVTQSTHYSDPIGPTRMVYKLVAFDAHGNESPAAVGVAYATLSTSAGALPRFVLERVWPNPTRGADVNVVFELPSLSPAVLELLDVSGRRVVSRSVHGLGIGRHSVPLGAGRRIPPGVYLVRLAQGAHVSVRRVVVLTQ